MAQYNISASGNQLIIELIVTDGDFAPSIVSLKTPSIKLTTDRIKFFDSAVYNMALLFDQINEIDGVAPTDLEDAADKIIALIANFNGGGAAPLQLKTLEGQSIIGFGDIDITKNDVGLSNVDNTSDLNKPVSTATTNALNLKVNNSSLGVPNGVATLSPTGKVPTTQLPDLTSGRKVTVANLSDRLALSAYADITIAYQADDASTWALDTNDDPSVAGNWTQLGNVSSGGVNSFNARTGNIVPQVGDYTSAMVGAAPLSHTHAQSEIIGLVTSLSSKINISDKGSPNGVANLGSDSKIPSIQIPDSVKARVVTVVNEAARLALPTVSQVSVVKQIDNNNVYFLPADVSPSLSAQWFVSGAGGGGATNFTALQDTPSTYAGEGGKMVVVDASEAFLKFAPIPSGSGGGLQFIDLGQITLNQSKLTTGSSILGVMELTAKSGLVSTMTSDVLPAPFVASASSFYPGLNAFRAFDGVTNNEWYSGNVTFPHWLKIDMGNTTAVSRYTIKRDDNYVGENPRTWTFEGSNDNTSWNVLDTQTNITFASSLEVKEFTLSSIATYRYYRLHITKTAANLATGYACVNQLTLLGTGATQYDAVQKPIDNVNYRVTTIVTGTVFTNNNLSLTKLSVGNVDKLVAIVSN